MLFFIASNNFAFTSMKRLWAPEATGHPDCPLCPCEYDLEKTVSNDFGSVKTCTCFCNRTPSQEIIGNEQNESSKLITEHGPLPGSVSVELYEYEDLEENIPQVQFH